jgi:hypothetical protein
MVPQSLLFVFLICLSNRTPAKARMINRLLKTRCSFQLSNEMIPPQLHGNSLLKVMMAPMYNVNATINISDAYNPFNLQRGIINKMETINSVNGKLHAMNGAMGCKMGDSPICSLKTEYSINLLMPVYKKSITNKKEIISTIVDFDIQVNNIFLFCITGPSIVIWLIVFNDFMFHYPSVTAGDRCSEHPPLTGTTL